MLSQEEADDLLNIAKLFDPTGSAKWWITEYDPIEKFAFCFVTGLVQDEWGYTSLIELESFESSVDTRDQTAGL